MKQGCKKQFCFNAMCRKNIFGKSDDSLCSFELLEKHYFCDSRSLTFSLNLDPVSQHFKTDKEMLQLAIDTLKKRPNDHDDLICSDTPTMNRMDIKNATGGKHLNS